MDKKVSLKSTLKYLLTIAKVRLLSRLRIIVGSGGTRQKGWISTDLPVLDVTSEKSWRRIFRPNSIERICAEHVFEHLGGVDTKTALVQAKIYLKVGGRIRLAVPDGNHPSEEYLSAVKPGGTGAGAHDHKCLFTIKDFESYSSELGFVLAPLEYFDVHGTFHKVEWKSEDGYIQRSSDNDSRNLQNPLSYTSLIADFIKV